MLEGIKMIKKCGKNHIKWTDFHNDKVFPKNNTKTGNNYSFDDTKQNNKNTYYGDGGYIKKNGKTC